MCALYCAQLLYTILHRTDLNFPPYPPDNHHSSDDVYVREGGWFPSVLRHSCLGDGKSHPACQNLWHILKILFHNKCRKKTEGKMAEQQRSARKLQLNGGVDSQFHTVFTGTYSTQQMTIKFGCSAIMGKCILVKRCGVKTKPGKYFQICLHGRL